MRPLPDMPTPGPRVTACAISPTPEPWADDALRDAARLHAVPAFVPAIGARPGEPPHPPAETDGRPRARRVWGTAALTAALVAVAVAAGAVR